MQKVCPKCQENFEVYPEDPEFLERLISLSKFKISIPAPTLCPSCRQQHRMSFRNERNLYQRTCDITGKKIISIFHPESEQKVCDKDFFYSENFEPLNYGHEFDFSKPFFNQFKEMLRNIPLPSLRVERSENCDFNNDVSDSKNCYLCARTHKCSDMLYTYRGNTSTSCADCYQVAHSELLYECIECLNSYNGRYLYFSTNCTDSAFLFDCHNCKDCLMCSNLKNKQYCYQNQQLTKEEYENILKQYNFGSHQDTQKLLKMFEAGIDKSIKRDLAIINSEDCSGDNIVNAKNCFMCFGVKTARDGRYLWDVKEYNDSMDIYSGGRNSELVYEATSTTASSNCKFCVRVTYSNNVDYSMFCHNCENCFGCIGLRGAKFCIFNKQYSEEEYQELVPKIIEHMKENNEWGEFFPSSLSPFGYNETVAMDTFPLKKTEAQNRGFNWSDYEAPNPEAKKFIKASELPDNIEDVENEITNWAIECEETGKIFKVTEAELRFYKKLKIPIPHLSPNARHKARLRHKKPLRLRSDKCQNCDKNIQTAWPKNTSNIYCSECYLTLSS